MSQGLTARLRNLMGSELFAAFSTLVFAVLYTWPFFTMDRPGKVFRFIFIVWAVHIALIAIMAFAARRIEASAKDAESQEQE